MKQVTRDEFFAALDADPRDIMPTIVSRHDPLTGYTSEWRNQKSIAREMFGKSDDMDGGRYWLADQAPEQEAEQP